jgi:hypothetical protein
MLQASLEKIFSRFVRWYFVDMQLSSRLSVYCVLGRLYAMFSPASSTPKIWLFPISVLLRQVFFQFGSGVETSFDPRHIPLRL